MKPYNPCNAPKEERFVAKVWEILRRNKKFKSKIEETVKVLVGIKDEKEALEAYIEDSQFFLEEFILDNKFGPETTIVHHIRNSLFSDQCNTKECFGIGNYLRGVNPKPTVLIKKTWEELPKPIKMNISDQIRPTDLLPLGTIENLVNNFLLPLYKKPVTPQIEIVEIINFLAELKTIFDNFLLLGISKTKLSGDEKDKVIDEIEKILEREEIQVNALRMRDSLMGTKKAWDHFLAFEQHTINQPSHEAECPLNPDLSQDFDTLVSETFEILYGDKSVQYKQKRQSGFKGDVKFFFNPRHNPGLIQDYYAFPKFRALNKIR